MSPEMLWFLAGAVTATVSIVIGMIIRTLVEMRHD